MRAAPAWQTIGRHPAQGPKGRCGLTGYELGLVMLSAVLHATWSAAIKDSRDPLAFNVLQIAVACVVGAVLLARVPMGAVPGDVWTTLAATGVAHGLYFYWLTRALEVADLTVVYPIARSTPAFLPLAAVPLLGESISVQGAVGIAIVVLGIWAVHAGRPLQWRRLMTRGAAWAYLTLAATVAYSLLDKRAMALLESQPWSSPAPLAVVFYFLMVGASAVVFMPLALRRRSVRTLTRSARLEWRRVLAAALLSFASYGLILEALRTALVSYVVAVRQISVLFAVILAVLWLGERPARLRQLGALAIVGGVALIAFSA